MGQRRTERGRERERACVSGNCTPEAAEAVFSRVYYAGDMYNSGQGRNENRAVGQISWGCDNRSQEKGSFGIALNCCWC